MNRKRRTLLAAFAALAGGGWCASIRAEEQIWRQLAAGGCAVLLRHARTAPGIGDPPGFRLDDCSTRRNLSAAGREQSRRFGAGFERRAIRIGEVLSSRWCRCVDTAQLAFPQHEVRLFEPLNSFFADGSSRDSQTAALRAHLAQQHRPRLLVMVTHRVNVTALTGQSVAMGEALVVRTGGGAAEVLGRLIAG
jgi:phosphohistidine phosphatase SixA